jgi:hypothetical protein
VSQLDLLNNLGESALFGEEVDLHRSRFGLRSRGWFFPALKTRPVAPGRRLRAASFDASRGRSLRRLVVGGWSSISLWSPGPIIGRTGAPGAIVPALSSPAMMTVRGIVTVIIGIAVAGLRFLQPIGR